MDKKEYMKKYRQENKDAIRDYQREYYSKNREDMQQKKKIWRENNKEKLKEYQKKYWDKKQNETEGGI